jgi:hypothetical protein
MKELKELCLLTREELAKELKDNKEILKCGTLVTYEDWKTKEHRIGVIGGDDRENSEEDLSDLNYYILTPETNWCWDFNYMDIYTCIVKVHGKADIFITYAGTEGQGRMMLGMVE